MFLALVCALFLFVVVVVVFDLLMLLLLLLLLLLLRSLLLLSSCCQVAVRDASIPFLFTWLCTMSAHLLVLVAIGGKPDYA